MENSQQKRSIYSNFLYVSNAEKQRKAPMKYGDFTQTKICEKEEKSEESPPKKTLNQTTQTSKTIIQLAEAELKNKHSSKTHPVHQQIDKLFVYPSSRFSSISSCGTLNKRSFLLQQTSPLLKVINSQSQDLSDDKTSSCDFSPRSTKSPNSYMAPTISSENKQFVSTSAKNLSRYISKATKRTRRGRSLSPRIHNSAATFSPGTSGSLNSWNIPNTCKNNVKNYAESVSNCSDAFLKPLLIKLKDKDWNICVQGLSEIVEQCRTLDPEIIYPQMTYVNQRVIELLRSPRSYVCRTACQAAGHLFETVRDTRRPEFDELVSLLLHKTADANKFIRQDANLALDCMVTHVQCVHSIRALCAHGPTHKNNLVRKATARLVICAVVVQGVENLFNQNNLNNNEHTRKRIITNASKFLEDKCVEVRKLGERLFKVLSEDDRFEMFLKKYLDKETVQKLQKNLQNMKSKRGTTTS